MTTRQRRSRPCSRLPGTAPKSPWPPPCGTSAPTVTAPHDRPPRALKLAAFHRRPFCRPSGCVRLDRVGRLHGRRVLTLHHPLHRNSRSLPSCCGAVQQFAGEPSGSLSYPPACPQQIFRRGPGGSLLTNSTSSSWAPLPGALRTWLVLGQIPGPRPPSALSTSSGFWCPRCALAWHCSASLEASRRTAQDRSVGTTGIAAR
jgi:hypothetical protein